ncbi:MAG: hypothetical protein K1X83_00625 [Oligoflexia bacterium]|nr:hypothetical protein [Oligoflexia bacterium]
MNTAFKTVLITFGLAELNENALAALSVPERPAALHSVQMVMPEPQVASEGLLASLRERQRAEREFGRIENMPPRPLAQATMSLAQLSAALNTSQRATLHFAGIRPDRQLVLVTEQQVPNIDPHSEYDIESVFNVFIGTSQELKNYPVHEFSSLAIERISEEGPDRYMARMGRAPDTDSSFTRFALDFIAKDSSAVTLYLDTGNPSKLRFTSSADRHELFEELQGQSWPEFVRDAGFAPDGAPQSEPSVK